MGLTFIQKFLKEGRKTLYNLVNKLDRRTIDPNPDQEIDVIIPVIEKDLTILPLCLKGVKHGVNHRIAAIYIVAPENEKIISFCKENNLVYVCETDVLGYSPGEVNFILANGENRSGWIFQQLLKLSGNVGKSRYFLTVDADHVLLKPHTFITKAQRLVFYQSRECHMGYYRNIKRLTGKYPLHLFSYISHKMIFDKELLTELRSMLETRSGKTWDQCIIDSLDRNDSSGFSEFELFGDFTPARQKIGLPWSARTFRYDCVTGYDELVRKYNRYRAITFPDYFSK